MIADENVNSTEFIAVNTVTSDNEPVTIEENPVALAATFKEEEQEHKKNWFWIIVIAIFGTAGEMLYKKYESEKENAHSTSKPKDK